MKISIPYGKEKVDLEIPDKNLIDVIYGSNNISNIEEKADKKTWGPNIGYFFLSSKTSSTTTTDSDLKYKGVSFGVKIPVYKRYSVVPQFLVGFYDHKSEDFGRFEDLKVYGARLDLRRDYIVNEFLSLGMGLSAHLFQMRYWAKRSDAPNGKISGYDK